MGTDLQINNTGLAGLIGDNEAIKEFRRNMENFTTLLNKAPKKEKIQTHQGYQYLPISTVEKDLDRLYFGLVQYECVSYSQIFNEIACHARIRVFHPVIMQWLTYDGLGSAVIQQDANTKVMDFNSYKKANALQLTLPKAYAEGIKNAAKKIGKAFGSDINRKFEDEYAPMYKAEKIPTSSEKELERMAHLINDAESLKDLESIKLIVPNELLDLFNEKSNALSN